MLFQIDKIPTYKSKPDIKDCEFVLSKFCEEIIRRKIEPIFSRDFFITKLETYCEERVIELEVSLVFDILYNNNIIIKKENSFSFRFIYWVYYFAAIRMRYDNEFAEFILQDKHYASYPEIIEFYTGSDRTREDALKILISDLREINEAVKSKVGMPESINPYKLMHWNPTKEAIEKMNEQLSENVQRSNLPDIVKDHYLDKNYDISKPFNQGLRKLFEEYSLSLLWEATRASSRALRNSDYVNPNTKRELLKEITKAWNHMRV